MTARSCTSVRARPRLPGTRPGGPHGHHDRHRDPRARGIRGLRGDLEGAEHAAHATHVRHERDPRDRAPRRPADPLLRGRGVQQGAARDRDHLRDDQHRRRVPRDRPDAGDVQGRPRVAGSPERRGRIAGRRGRGFVTVLVSFPQDRQFIETLYIVAFTLCTLGIIGLAGPRTAPRGNRLAAVGMAVALVATLLIPNVIKDGGDVALMALGIGIGTAVGVPAARRVKITAMPQMVALFNGVGGGAVALIAWSEFRTTDALAGEPLYVVIASLFGAIVGSVSFWGSLVAFGKLQEILPGRPLGLGRAQQAV